MIRNLSMFVALSAFALAGRSLSADDVPAEVLRQAAHVTPTLPQLAWQEMEFNCFVHFGMSTYTGIERLRWKGVQHEPLQFNPTAFDADQWVSACKEAGMKMLVLTCKHHDGFCLWPSKCTEYSVKHSPWRGGKGDVVREVSDACRRGGIKFGIYLSPWDCHEKTYGTDAYNDYYASQLRELFSNYGEITELWWDLYCGSGFNYNTQYDWARWEKVVRDLQPKTVIFGMEQDITGCGAGNEQGFSRFTQWSVVADMTRKRILDGFADMTDFGDRKYLAGAQKIAWCPAECCVSLQPQWFYCSTQNDTVKSLKQLLEIYYSTVGWNTVLLLNVPPDRRGLFRDDDIVRLRELRAVLDETFKDNLAKGKTATASSVATGHPAAMAVDGSGDTYWTTADGLVQASLEVDLGQPTTFDRAILQEMITTGQRVERFKLEAWDGHQWAEIARATTIGYKRLLRFPTVTASKVRLTLLDARDCPTIREFGLFKASPRENE